MRPKHSISREDPISSLLSFILLEIPLKSAQRRASDEIKMIERKIAELEQISILQPTLKFGMIYT